MRACPFLLLLSLLLTLRQASQSSDIARLAQHKQQQAGMQNPYSNQSVQSLEGAQSLILAAPSVLPGHANRQVSQHTAI